MDKTLVIGCRTTENELLAVMRAAGISYDLVWIEARLHNVKKKLNKALSDLISEAENYDTILFATGFCGNSVLGLESSHARLVRHVWDTAHPSSSAEPGTSPAGWILIF